MKKFIIAVIIPVICGILIGFYFFSKQKNNEAKPESTWTTYQNNEYGFKLSYPKKLEQTGNFKKFYNLSNSWMFEAMDTPSKGIPLVSIIIYRIENKPYYPRYYDVELRIGASKNPKDIKNCYKSIQDIKPSSKEINGNLFTVYDIQDAAMMQYIQGRSFRIIRNNTCFALERLKT